MTERADFVRERHLQCMERVAGVLDHRRAFERQPVHRRPDGVVRARYHVAAPLFHLPDDGEGRVAEIFDSAALPEEFRVRADAEIDAGAQAARAFERRNHLVDENPRQ